MIDEYLKKVIIEAGRIIKENFYSKKDVKFKGLIDLVTNFDIEIEKFLIEKLRNVYKDFNFIGEEEAYNEDIISTPNRVYIDPIDGTTNFVHSIPFVAISIGVIKNYDYYEGIVYNPILEEFFYAKKGKGAYLNDKKIEVSNENELGKSLVVTGFPYDIRENEYSFNWNIEVVKRVLKETLAFRRLGSAAIDLCYVARGSYEIFYEMGLKPWDVAAGIVIVEEAGGKVTNEKGKRFDLHKDKIIVATNFKLHNNFLRLINKGSASITGNL